MLNQIPTHALSGSLCSVILLVLLSPSVFTSTQVKKPGLDIKPAPPATKTKLEVQEYSKEFEQWVKTLTITSPKKLSFRWSTDEADATAARWAVSDKPISFGNALTPAAAVQQPHVIKSGVLGKAPAKGKFLTFEINFALFAPANPPQTPRTYWVFVTPTNWGGRVREAVGLPSVPVKVVYRKPSTEIVHFPECFGNTQCSIGYYCTQSNECKVVGYVCDGHVVKGSDGSVYECSPYICQAGQCLKTCASVDDCNSPYVCNQNYKCVAPPKN
jgi:hypothetical protein